MLNEMNRNKVITHDQIMTVMYTLDIPMDNFPAVCAIMSQLFKSTPNERMTVQHLCDFYSKSFSELTDMLSGNDITEAMKVLTAIVQSVEA